MFIIQYAGGVFLRKLDLEGCVKAAAGAGAKGIELIPEQMCWQEYLSPSDEFANQWKEWMEKYDVEPTAIDVYFDYRLFGNRVLTKKSSLKCMRIIYSLPSSSVFR